VINALNIDSSKDKELSNQTWNHMVALAEESVSKNLPLILFLHVPLYKPAGFCRDDPKIHYNTEGYVTEQAMISEESTIFILENLKPIFVFDGHDHFGCKYQHNNQTTEYTIRSLMGDFGGYTAVLEIKAQQQPTQYEYHILTTSFVIIYAITVLIVMVALWFVLFALCLLTSCIKQAR